MGEMAEDSKAESLGVEPAAASNYYRDRMRRAREAKAHRYASAGSGLPSRIALASAIKALLEDYSPANIDNAIRLVERLEGASA